MEYNFITNLLAKFAACSDLIKAVIIINIGVMFVSLLYFIKQSIAEFIKSSKANN